MAPPPPQRPLTQPLLFYKMSHIVSCEGLNFTRFILNLLVLSFVGFLLGSGIGGPLEGSLRDVSSLDVTMKLILSKLLLNLMEQW